jgi:hypothetical protein
MDIIVDTKPKDRLSFFLEQVKNYDYDLYLCLCFIPKDLLKTITILFCFEIEMQKILISSNEEIIKRIKFKWWHDAIETQTHYNNPLLEEIFRDTKLLDYSFTETIKFYENLCINGDQENLDWPEWNIFTYSDFLLSLQNNQQLLEEIYQKYFKIKNYRHSSFLSQSFRRIEDHKIKGPLKILNKLFTWQKENIDKHKEFRKPGVIKLLNLFFFYKF